MKTFLLAVLAAVVGYIGGAIVGMVAITQLSANTHDKSVEAAMTSIFVIGPLASLLAVAAVFVVRSTRRQP